MRTSWVPAVVWGLLLTAAFTVLAGFAFHIPGLPVPVSTWKVPF